MPISTFNEIQINRSIDNSIVALKNCIETLAATRDHVFSNGIVKLKKFTGNRETLAEISDLEIGGYYYLVLFDWSWSLDGPHIIVDDIEIKEVCKSKIESDEEEYGLPLNHITLFDLEQIKEAAEKYAYDLAHNQLFSELQPNRI